MRKPVVAVDKENGVITIDGMVLDLDILGRIFTMNVGCFWQFSAGDGRIIAEAFEQPTWGLGPQTKRAAKKARRMLM